ncbi:hypothetical protein BJV82DRAFT_676292 [Fennellomyces sp. T-0311]|nr:hypothetical protein BJV82DRAFT_676292 [Fennellomyces sp. T-0311]
MQQHCPFPNCKHRRPFKNSFALDQHINVSHPSEPFPEARGADSANLTRHHTAPVPQSPTDNAVQDMDWDSAYYSYEPDPTAAVPIEKVSQRSSFEEAIVEISNQRVTKKSLRGVDKKLATYALDHGVSNAEYAQIASIVQDAFDEGHASAQPLILKAKTKDKMKAILSSDAHPCATIPFQYYDVDLSQIDDFPKEHEAAFRGAVGSLTLGYRNVVDLCQHLFSHPAFSKDIVLSARQWRRDGTRIYGDIDSGTWWEELQAQLPNDYVVLSIILASDQTAITGNFRYKAWPVYLTLGNIPSSIREKLEDNARRVLAFLPCIEWDGPTEKAPSWFVPAKLAVIHHCLEKIFALFKNKDGTVPAYELKGPNDKIYRCVPALTCYMADLPEQ